MMTNSIGLETAVDLARRGARLILACRSVERGERAAVQVRKRSGNKNVVFIQLDLASLDSIRAFAQKILEEEPYTNILVNNAAVALKSHQKTSDGFEEHMGVNHLGHFLLTNLLLPSMKAASSARIVTVSSSLFKKCPKFDFTKMDSSDPTMYSRSMPGLAYCQSKLANVLFTRALAKHLEATNICTNAVHPGVIFRTNLSRHFYTSLSFHKVNLIIVSLPIGEQGHLD